ncbi:hypothetical protein GCM10022384_55810 [Streptomyces marokkonensis]|uniref:Uncharacterized protein n=1 Tax=Streptomyces marokkonensis TaxID=324855 RepID=A0ABP7RSY5_9ACTN
MACEDGHAQCAQPKPGRLLSESPVRNPASGTTETLISAVQNTELDREVNAGVLGFHPVRQQETRLPKPLITNRGRVRVPSSLIRVLQRHCADTDSTCPEPEPSQLV